MKTQSVLLATLVAAGSAQAVEFEASGYIGAEWREHYQKSQWLDEDGNRQPERQLGLVIEPEFAWSFADGDHVVVFKPYGRYDNEDDRRTHGDIRELSWLTFGDDWELKAGISKVYWGVTESQHLVDIVNQTDFVEAPDGEDKLGQPMVKLTFIRDWGTVDTFVLPGFRERTFPGLEGRLRPGAEVRVGKAEYQSDDEDRHIDYALRWSHTIDDYDVGVSFFTGTSRDPLFIPDTEFSQAQNQPVPTGKILPFYPQIRQVAVDAQATLESWLWKFEGIYREFDDSVRDDFEVQGQDLDNYTAATGGFEYTFYGPFETPWDLGVLAEYQYDSREDVALATGQNDLFVGSRLAFNDEASSEILAGVTQDLDQGSTRGFLVEASTRVGDQVKVSVDWWIFTSADDDNLSYQFRQDDYIQFTANWYY